MKKIFNNPNIVIEEDTIYELDLECLFRQKKCKCEKKDDVIRPMEGELDKRENNRECLVCVVD